MSVRVRRVYEPPEAGDGVRVLVDRLWPRGVSKDAARVGEWPKGLIIPSARLRRWYHVGEGSFAEFTERYEAEPATPEETELLDHVAELAAAGDVTLLTASTSPGESHAAVPQRLLGGS